jgi:thiol:disulfide interchange protein DsbD
MAGLFGSNIQAAFQNPWIIFSFSAIFVALAFSMFGFYDLELPQSLQTKLTKKSDEARGKGGIVGVAVMGFLSALIVGPCIAAPLAGALIYIGQTADALLGGAALFVMSIGMGTPLLIIGIGAGRYMPKPGAWMDGVKSFFGIVLLGVAIWMMSRVVSIEVTMFLTSLLLIVSSVVLGVFEHINKMLRSVLIVAFIYGVSILVGLMAGSQNLIKPLSVFVSTVTATDVEPTFKKIKTLSELQDIIKTSSKPVFVDFYADWCTSCVELEHTTFKDQRVKKLFDEFTLLKVDVTKNSEEDKKLLKNFGLFGPPGLLFFADQKEIVDARLVGYIEANKFQKHLQKVLRISK